MQSLAQLESKILILQAQIQATQAQITDYQTNPAYVDYYYLCLHCKRNIGKNTFCPCRRNPFNLNILSPSIVQFFTKTAELAQAQAQLATLQNELKTTQAQYEQAKARAMILNQAFVSTTPPSKIQASIKVINAIDSLRQYLQTIS